MQVAVEEDTREDAGTALWSPERREKQRGPNSGDCHRAHNKRATSYSAEQVGGLPPYQILPQVVMSDVAMCDVHCAMCDV